jgi:hypothetical protein
MTRLSAKAELPQRRPMVLVPYDRREAITLHIAAKIAGKCEATVTRWCAIYNIGRRISNGPWQVSRVALQMLLDGAEDELREYLRGDRSGPLVAPYFANLDSLDGLAGRNRKAG